MEEDTHSDLYYLEMYPSSMADEKPISEVTKRTTGLSRIGPDCCNGKALLRDSYLTLKTVNLCENNPDAINGGLQGNDFLQIEGQETQIKQDSFVWLPALQKKDEVVDLNTGECGEISQKRRAPDDNESKERKKIRLPFLNLVDVNLHYKTKDKAELQTLPEETVKPGSNDQGVLSTDGNKTVSSFDCLCSLKDTQDLLTIAEVSDAHLPTTSHSSSLSPWAVHTQPDRMVPGIVCTGVTHAGETDSLSEWGSESDGCSSGSVVEMESRGHEVEAVAKWLPEE